LWDTQTLEKHHCHALKHFYQNEQSRNEKKTLYQFISNIFNFPKSPQSPPKVITDGVEIHEISIDDPSPTGNDKKEAHKMKVNVWDFAGQEDYYLTHRFFLTSNSLILYVWDMTLDTQDHEYWFQSIQSIAPDSKIIVVGTRLGICCHSVQ
jgi:leucine-rich repeat kinase 2